VQVILSQIEFLPQLVPTAPQKKLNLPLYEIIELKNKFPDIDELPPMGRLTGDHLMLGWWVIRRDIGDSVGFYLLPPMVAVAFTEAAVDAEAGETKKKASELMKRRWRRSGLLGIPAVSFEVGEGCERWILLVLRRCNNEIQVQYYDSLQSINMHNLRKAQLILKELWPEVAVPPGVAVPPEASPHADPPDGPDIIRVNKLCS
jgi:hypothetical protein